MDVALDFVFHARMWLYEGESAWHFATLPKAMSARIKSLTAGKNRAWGSLRVEATIGETRWKTSIFRDRKTGAYLLPIKASVRTREQLRAGDSVEIALIVELDADA